MGQPDPLTLLDQLGLDSAQQAAAVKPLLSDDPEVRMAGPKKHRLLEWQMTLTFFVMIRFARFAAFLQQREPDDRVNYSILVDRLNEEDVARALEGPPPELGRDIVADSLQAGNSRSGPDRRLSGSPIAIPAACADRRAKAGRPRHRWRRTRRPAARA
jgi:hypothetical protein